MPFRSITDEQYAAADAIVQEGKPVTEAARQTGISAQTLYKRYRPSADPTPGGRRKQTPINKPGPSDEQLVEFFTKAAVLPSLPAGLILHCDFCAAHFVNTGPHAAQQLVDLSKDTPALRSIMEAIWRQWQEAAWAALLLTWMGIPIAHHLAPDAIYRWLVPITSLPPRGSETPPHTHANGNGQAAPTVDVPTPFAGMDVDALMGMARSMGFNFPDPGELLDNAATEDDAATAEPDADAAEESEPADTDHAEEAETVTTDTDADE